MYNHFISQSCHIVPVAGPLSILPSNGSSQRTPLSGTSRRGLSTGPHSRSWQQSLSTGNSRVPCWPLIRKSEFVGVHNCVERDSISTVFQTSDSLDLCRNAEQKLFGNKVWILHCGNAAEGREIFCGGLEAQMECQTKSSDQTFFGPVNGKATQEMDVSQNCGSQKCIMDSWLSSWNYDFETPHHRDLLVRFGFAKMLI